MASSLLQILFKLFIYLFILSFLHLLTWVYIVWATYPPPHTHILLDRICSNLLFSDFVEEKKGRDNMKDIAFLLVWDNDRYTERFLALLPCTCVLQPTGLYYTSSLLPGPLPIVASASLRLLYLLFCSKHVNHIQLFGFLPFPYFSHVCSPLSVWPISNNITGLRKCGVYTQ
jgi:hypothetical protein